MAKKSGVLNVGVIGLGMGRGHLADYSKNARANVVGICDVQQDRLARSASEFKVPGGRCFTEYKKMLAQARRLGLQAVSVALPNHLHAPATLAALDAGLHVLCEKPMATSVAEARAMLQAADKARKKLMINFSFMFTEQSQALKRVVDSGAIGDIYFGRTVWHRRRGLPGFGGWFGLKAQSGGGPIIDLGVHRLHLALWLMGYPRPVAVMGSTYSVIGSRLAKEQGKKFDVEDLGCAMIRFQTGATLILEASWAGFSEKREDMVTQLYGTKGGIIQRNLAEGYQFEAKVYTEEAGTLWEKNIQQVLVPPVSAYSEFVDAVLEDRQPQAPGRAGLAIQVLLDAIYESAATGREVKIARA